MVVKGEINTGDILYYPGDAKKWKVVKVDYVPRSNVVWIDLKSGKTKKSVTKSRIIKYWSRSRGKIKKEKKEVSWLYR